MRPKAAWQFWGNLSRESIAWKIFEGEMLIRTLPTTLLQIFCKVILISKVYPQNYHISQTDNIWRNLWWVKVNQLMLLEGFIGKLSSRAMILLTITFELGIILQKIWRRVVGNVLINISPSNILPIVLKPERFLQNCQAGFGFGPLWALMG